MEINLKNKVCLITGGASGIGLGIAEAYVTNGAKLAIVDYDKGACDSATHYLQEKYDEQVFSIPADVTEELIVEAAITKIIDHFGRLDVVNCNAGIQTISSLTEFDYSQWKKVIDTHLNGSFLFAKAAMKVMKQQTSGGSIIITGSVHSFLASENKSAYVAAKHAQLGLVRAIAKEGGRYNIRANLLAPGFVLTPLVEKQIPELAKKFDISEEDVVKKIMLKDTVDGQFTTIEDVAKVSLFLASFESNALTGQSIIVSNGWCLD